LIIKYLEKYIPEEPGIGEAVRRARRQRLSLRNLFSYMGLEFFMSKNQIIAKALLCTLGIYAVFAFTNALLSNMLQVENG